MGENMEKETKEEGVREATFENAMEELRNRRLFIKKAMEPAVKAAKELVKDTATEEARLQGTKETKAPSLKPYTEGVHVKTRRELGSLIREAREQGLKWSIKRCSEDKLSEGYRYTFISEAASEPAEDKEEPAEEADELPPAEADIQPVEAPEAEAEEHEEDPMAMAAAILLPKLSVFPTADGDGTIRVCARGCEDESCCIALTGFSAEDLEALAPILEEPRDLEPEVDDAGLETAEISIGGEEPEIEPEEPAEGDGLEEASSAEKRAYRNAGKELDDLRLGRALAKVKDPDERQMFLHQHRMEQAGKKMGDRPGVEDALARKLGQSDREIGDKFAKMQKAGIKGGDELDESAKIALDDLKLFKPTPSAEKLWGMIIEQGKLPELDAALEHFYPDGIPASELNNMLLFEADWIIEQTGLKPFTPKEDAITVDAEEVK